MDTLARFYAEQLQTAFGKPLIVESQPGAGQQTALSYVMRAPADGHTLLLATSGLMATGPALFKRLSLETVNNLMPISIYAKSPFVLVVNPKFAAQSVADFAKLASSATSPIT